MDTIFIRELRLPARVGLHRHERIAPQTIELEIEFGVPGPDVFRSGRVSDTIDYGVVVERVRAMLVGEHFGLVENLADRIARMLIDEFNAPTARVGITKLGVLKDARRVGVVVERRRDDAPPKPR